MPRKRDKPEEIIALLCQVDVQVSQGSSVADAIDLPAALLILRGVPRYVRSDHGLAVHR